LGTLPDGSTGGSTAGVEIGRKGEIWTIERCGANSCDGSDLPSIHMLDLKTGKPAKSIGAGLFVFPRRKGARVPALDSKITAAVTV
jgi:hypothetical protein